MSCNVSTSQLMIGLPSSGKTTFLAALWYIVAHANSHVEGSLKLHNLEGGDKDYINKICNQWVSATTVDRTKISDEEIVSMVLKDPVSGDIVRLNFPDLSGESFEQQWSARQATINYQEAVSSSKGFLLLVHPGEVKQETLINEANDLINDLETMQGTDNSKIIEEPSKHTYHDDSEEWSSDKTPTQIQLVELLQFVVEIKKSEPFNLAILVSAWDTVVGEKSPKTWIQKNLPLLYQYIESNQKLAKQYYGISAQGGDYRDKESLLDTPSPETRIKVALGASTVSNDISIPVRWLMEK